MTDRGQTELTELRGSWRDYSIFQGPFAIGVAVSFLLEGAAHTVLICLGGAPLPAEAGRYVLNDHGTLTEVSRAVWLIAKVCDVMIPVAWISVVLFIMALFARKVIYAEGDRGKSHAILVVVALVASLVVPQLAYVYLALSGS